LHAARFHRLLGALALFLLLFVQPLARADSALEAIAPMLPDTIGDFRARGPASMPHEGLFQHQSPEEFAVTGSAVRPYVSAGGEKIGIQLVKTRSDSGAYALLTNQKRIFQQQAIGLDGVGSAAIRTPSGVLFFKGPALVKVYNLDKTPSDTEGAVTLARLFADTLDKGEGEIPVLVKHLPEAEGAQERAVFAVSLAPLQEAAGNRPILDAISFEGGAEAVTATYGPSRLVIVENMTPQLATTQDARIKARLKELGDVGLPGPTVYRRVGNYSVFVFDAPDEVTALKLIEGIKYEQVVQWLGDNPNDLKRAQRRYTETTAGVILAVLKASGISLLLCLGVGAVFGGIVFKRRRQQQAAREAFSDAGGMVRLNLDEMTPQYDSGKLLGPTKQT